MATGFWMAYFLGAATVVALALLIALFVTMAKRHPRSNERYTRRDRNGYWF